MKSFKKLKNKEGGLSIIGIIIIIVIVIIVLSYFNINIQSNVESPQTQGNLAYVWSGVVYVWNTFLRNPILYFWNNIFIAILWNGFVHNMSLLNNGQAPIDFNLDWLPHQ